MAILKNIARMTTATTGTGTITLGSAATGFLSFSGAGVADTNSVTYGIEDGSNREIGRGTYTSSGTTLTRTVLKSTNSDTAISLSGTAQVFITFAVEDVGNLALAQAWAAAQTFTVAPVFTDASGSRTALGLAIDTNVQAYDAQLSSVLAQNSKSAAYTTELTDGGKHILHPSADTTARVFTIDSNANVAYPLGTTLTFVNQISGGVITISITSDTMWLSPGGTTGSRTLAASGVATALKITTTGWIISGSGLT